MNIIMGHLCHDDGHLILLWDKYETLKSAGLGSAVWQRRSPQHTMSVVTAGKPKHQSNGVMHRLLTGCETSTACAVFGPGTHALSGCVEHSRLCNIVQYIYSLPFLFRYRARIV